MKRLLILLLFWSVCGTTLRAAQAPVQPEKYRPQWQIGQQWVVQTESRQQQAAVGRQKVVTARWQFRAEAVEQVQGQACIRIAVRPFEGRQIQQEPKTTVWIDRTTSSIRQIQVQLPTRKGYKTVTESYKPDQEGAPGHRSPFRLADRNATVCRRGASRRSEPTTTIRSRARVGSRRSARSASPPRSGKSSPGLRWTLSNRFRERRESRGS